MVFKTLYSYIFLYTGMLQMKSLVILVGQSILTEQLLMNSLCLTDFLSFHYCVRRAGYWTLLATWYQSTLSQPCFSLVPIL